MITFTESILLLLSVIIIWQNKKPIELLYESKNKIKENSKEIISQINNYKAILNETLDENYCNKLTSISNCIAIGIYIIFYLMSIGYINTLIFNSISITLILIALWNGFRNIKYINDPNLIKIQNIFYRILNIAIDIVYVVYIVYHVLVRIIYN